MARKVMSIAAATGRVAYTYFEGRKLADFALSYKASETPADAAHYAKRWIEMLDPDVVITEKITKSSNKGDNTHAVIKAMAREAANHVLNEISIARQQLYPNKYVEADVYAKRFPDLNAVLPRKPRIWESEPANMMYFEAIALALPIIDHSDPKC